MLRRFTILVLTGLAIIGMGAGWSMSTGCGGGGSVNADDEASLVFFSASASSAGKVFDTISGPSRKIGKASVTKDATAGATGSGGGTLGSLNDSAQITCQFSVREADGSLQTTDSGIMLVENEGDCTSLNKCIVCTMPQTAEGCSISCTGTVPSNAQTAADSFDVRFISTGEFHTDMTSAGGAIRFDTMVDEWPEFDMSTGCGGGSCINYSDGCSGGSNMTVANNTPNLYGDSSWSNTVSSDELHHALGITALDGITTDESGRQICVITQTHVASMSLASAATPGGVIDITRGSVFTHGQICDDATNCPAYYLGAFYPCEGDPEILAESGYFSYTYLGEILGSEFDFDQRKIDCIADYEEEMSYPADMSAYGMGTIFSSAGCVSVATLFSAADSCGYDASIFEEPEPEPEYCNAQYASSCTFLSEAYCGSAFTVTGGYLHNCFWGTDPYNVTGCWVNGDGASGTCSLRGTIANNMSPADGIQADHQVVIVPTPDFTGSSNMTAFKLYSQVNMDVGYSLPYEMGYRPYWSLYWGDNQHAGSTWTDVAATCEHQGQASMPLDCYRTITTGNLGSILSTYGFDWSSWSNGNQCQTLTFRWSAGTGLMASEIHVKVANQEGACDVSSSCDDFCSAAGDPQACCNFILKDVCMWEMGVCTDQSRPLGMACSDYLEEGTCEYLTNNECKWVSGFCYDKCTTSADCDGGAVCGEIIAPDTTSYCSLVGTGRGGYPCTELGGECASGYSCEASVCTANSSPTCRDGFNGEGGGCVLSYETSAACNGHDEDCPDGYECGEAGFCIEYDGPPSCHEICAETANEQTCCTSWMSPDWCEWNASELTCDNDILHPDGIETCGAIISSELCSEEMTGGNCQWADGACESTYPSCSSLCTGGDAELCCANYIQNGWCSWTGTTCEDVYPDGIDHCEVILSDQKCVPSLTNNICEWVGGLCRETGMTGNMCRIAMVNPPSNSSATCASITSESTCSASFEQRVDDSFVNCAWNGSACYTPESGSCYYEDEYQIITQILSQNDMLYPEALMKNWETVYDSETFTLYMEYIGDGTHELVNPGLYAKSSSGEGNCWSVTSSAEGMVCNVNNTYCYVVMTPERIAALVADADCQYAWPEVNVGFYWRAADLVTDNAPEGLGPEDEVSYNIGTQDLFVHLVQDDEGDSPPRCYDFCPLGDPPDAVMAQLCCELISSEACMWNSGNSTCTDVSVGEVTGVDNCDDILSDGLCNNGTGGHCAWAGDAAAGGCFDTCETDENCSAEYPYCETVNNMPGGSFDVCVAIDGTIPANNAPPLCSSMCANTPTESCCETELSSDHCEWVNGYCETVPENPINSCHDFLSWNTCSNTGGFCSWYSGVCYQACSAPETCTSQGFTAGYPYCDLANSICVQESTCADLLSESTCENSDGRCTWNGSACVSSGS